MDQLTTNSNDLVTKVREEAKRLMQVAKSLREQKQDGNEQYTKLSMILPMLRALGYTTDSFPPEVRPEYQLKLVFSKPETKFVDYAIYIDNAQSPCIFVEAKALCENLDEHVEQLASYHKQEDNVKLSILTNGDEWRIYMTKADHSSDMSKDAILKVTLSSLANNKDRLKDFIDYIARKNFSSSSSISIAELVKNNNERDALYTTFRNLFNCSSYADIELLDDDFIKYILRKSNIDIKLTASVREGYRQKVFDALQHELEVLKATYFNQMTSEKLGIQQTNQSALQDKKEIVKLSDSEQISESDSTNDCGSCPYTKLEKDINKRIYNILINSNSPIILSNKNMWSEGEALKYFNAAQFVKFVITNRSQDEINKLSKFSEKGQSFAVSYGNRSYTKNPDAKDTAQFDISKGAIGFNILNEEGKLAKELLNSFKDKYEIIERGGLTAGAGAEIGVYVSSMEDFDILSKIIIASYEARLQLLLGDSK